MLQFTYSTFTIVSISMADDFVKDILLNFGLEASVETFKGECQS